MRYQNASADNLPKEVTEKINEAIKEKKGILFYGGTGVGKTYTMHTLAKNKGKVENFVEMLVEFIDYQNKGFYYDKLKELTNQDYLFIDDIGSEKTTEFVITFLYLIVNKRYENMKRTVFATNLSLEDFSSRYGDRILSRINEMCLLVELKGEDKRI